NQEEVITSLNGAQSVRLTTKIPFRDRAGKICGLVGMGRNITDRKKAEHALRESEARYRLLLDKAPAPMFVQTNQRFAYVNHALLKLLGATHYLQVLGERIVDFVAPEFHDAVEDRMRTVNEQQIATPAMQMKYIRRDGESVDGEVSSVPTEFNGHQGALVFVNDISERNRHEATLLQAKAAAEAGSAAKSEFLAMM